MHIQTFKQTQNSHQCSFQNPASIDFENPNLTRLKFRYSWHEYPTSNQFSISYKFSIISLFGQLASSIVMRCGNFQVPFYCLIKDQATKSKVYWISILLYSLLTSDWNDCSIRHQSFFFLQQRNPRGTGSVSFDSLDSLHKKWINQSLIYNSLSISFSLDLYWTNWKEVTEKQSSPKCQTRQFQELLYLYWTNWKNLQTHVIMSYPKQIPLTKPICSSINQVTAWQNSIG